MLINLKRAEVRNNEVSVVLFSLLFVPLKVNIPLLLTMLKRSEKFVVDPSKKKEIVCRLRARAKQSLVSNSLVLKGLVDS